MTDTSDDRVMTPREEEDALAAEYVLGVLDLPERLAVEKRLRTDDDFAGLVLAWESRLAGLNDEFAETAAPMNLLTEIEARLFPVEAKPKRSWLSWLPAAAAATVLAVAVLVLLPTPGPAPLVVAELSTQDATLVYEASYQSGNLLITRQAGARPPQGQDHELWIIAPGAAPVSLGILGDDTLRVATPLPPAGWVLAVSVEPAGGSTTGAPTGPVIMTAEISA